MTPARVSGLNIVLTALFSGASLSNFLVPPTAGRDGSVSPGSRNRSPSNVNGTCPLLYITAADTWRVITCLTSDSRVAACIIAACRWPRHERISLTYLYNPSPTHFNLCWTKHAIDNYLKGLHGVSIIAHINSMQFPSMKLFNGHRQGYLFIIKQMFIAILVAHYIILWICTAL